jgi:hypothetical protein
LIPKTEFSMTGAEQQPGKVRSGFPSGCATIEKTELAPLSVEE